DELGGFSTAERVQHRRARTLCVDDVRQGVVKLLGLVVVHRNDQTAAALERNADDDEATFLDSLHRSVSGPGLHGCHRIPFRKRSTRSIIPYIDGTRKPSH